jgi:hypothetical protein
MASCSLVLWVLGQIGAGWVAGKIAKRRGAVWVLAGLLGIYLAAVHLVLYWPRFPCWYNLGVVVPAVPAVLFGFEVAANLVLKNVPPGYLQAIAFDSSRPHGTVSFHEAFDALA